MLHSLFLSSSPTTLSESVARRAILREFGSSSLCGELLEEIGFARRHNLTTSVSPLTAVSMALSLLNWSGSRCSKFEYNLDTVSRFLAQYRCGE